LLAYALVVALLLGVSADAAMPPPRPGGGGPGHVAQPAPGQRWGSAADAGREPRAGAGDRAGGSANRTVPASTRSRYPLLSLPQEPASPRNTARVAEPPPAGYRGYHARTSRELPSGRGQYERTYANADGTQTTEFSGAPVNYRGPDGSWAPIDPRLEPAGAGWHNAADAVDVWLAGRADAAELVRLALDSEHTIGYGLAGARPVTGRTGPDRTTVTYPDAVPGVDVELRSQPGGVKEALVLHSAGAPREYVFPLSLRGPQGRRVAAGDRSAAVPRGRRQQVRKGRRHRPRSAMAGPPPAMRPGGTQLLTTDRTQWRTNRCPYPVQPATETDRSVADYQLRGAHRTERRPGPDHLRQQRIGCGSPEGGCVWVLTWDR
jgi:hypothetical protein